MIKTILKYIQHGLCRECVVVHSTAVLSIPGWLHFECILQSRAFWKGMGALHAKYTPNFILFLLALLRCCFRTLLARLFELRPQGGRGLPLRGCERQVSLAELGLREAGRRLVSGSWTLGRDIQKVEPQFWARRRLWCRLQNPKGGSTFWIRPRVWVREAIQTPRPD